jgi:hypothetical protein
MQPEGSTVDLTVLAGDLGLGSSGGPSSRMVHALDRLERFKMLARFSNELWVRTTVPVVPEHLVRRLSQGVQVVHREMALGGVFPR